MVIQYVRLVRPGHHVQAAVVHVHRVNSGPCPHYLVGRAERKVEQVLEM